MNRLMLFIDPPDHTRLRALVSKAFTPRRVTGLEPRISEMVDGLLDPILAAGAGELMAQFAHPLPARVICDLIGVPSHGVPVIVEHAPALATGLDPNPVRSPDSLAAANRDPAAFEVTDGRPAWRPSFTVRGLQHLNVRVG